MKPKNYSIRVNDILSGPGQEAALIKLLKKLGEITQEAKDLCGPLYNSKYSMK